MVDKREAILVRTLAVLGAIADIKTVARNLDETADISRPALILLDADEEPANDQSNTVSAQAPDIVTMIPQIRILLGAVPEDIGTELNVLRARVVKAIRTDSELETLAGRRSNGRIRYHGCETALGHGRTMDGDMLIRIAFTYRLDPNQL